MCVFRFSPSSTWVREAQKNLVSAICGYSLHSGVESAIVLPGQEQRLVGTKNKYLAHEKNPHDVRWATRLVKYLFEDFSSGMKCVPIIPLPFFRIKHKFSSRIAV